MAAFKSEYTRSGEIRVSLGALGKWALGIIATWVTIGGVAFFVQIINVKENQALMQQEQAYQGRDIEELTSGQREIRRDQQLIKERVTRIEADRAQ